MPGWGTGNFENEDAQNFLGRLNSLGIDDLKQILARAADQDDYLEAPESSVAVAAVEVVAALGVSRSGDTSSSATPKQIVEWVSKNDDGISPDLVDLAGRAVDRVRTNSELKDLWLEAEGLNEWSASLRDLKERLSGCEGIE